MSEHDAFRGFRDMYETFVTPREFQATTENLATKADLESLRNEFLKKNLEKTQWLAILTPTVIAALVGVVAWIKP